MRACEQRTTSTPLALDSPLEVKFQADALGKTVLFVGYSMSDMNIRLLLHNLWRTWQKSGYEKDRPKSFAFIAVGCSLQPRSLTTTFSLRLQIVDRRLDNLVARGLDPAVPRLFIIDGSKALFKASVRLKE